MWKNLTLNRLKTTIMKKLYIFTLFVLTFCTSIAQPTFNLNSFPAIGSSSTSYDVSASILSPGNSGAGQTWNFSSATGTLATNTVTMVAPSATPFSSLFPTSNQAGVTISTGGNDAYGYYVTILRRLIWLVQVRMVLRLLFWCIAIHKLL